MTVIKALSTHTPKRIINEFLPEVAMHHPITGDYIRLAPQVLPDTDSPPQTHTQQPHHMTTHTVHCTQEHSTFSARQVKTEPREGLMQQNAVML